jgi:hypothetical protein
MFLISRPLSPTRLLLTFKTERLSMLTFCSCSAASGSISTDGVCGSKNGKTCVGSTFGAFCFLHNLNLKAIIYDMGIQDFWILSTTNICALQEHAAVVVTSAGALVLTAALDGTYYTLLLHISDHN